MDTLQVLDIQILFPSAPSQDSRSGFLLLPVLRLHLEDGSFFTMGSIPNDTAIAIYQKIQNQSKGDYRYSSHDVLSEISLITAVTIDCLVPKSSAFAATLTLKIEGFSNEMQFQMIPSQAVLLAMTANAPIYVSREMIKIQQSQGE